MPSSAAATDIFGPSSRCQLDSQKMGIRYAKPGTEITLEFPGRGVTYRWFDATSEKRLRLWEIRASDPLDPGPAAISKETPDGRRRLEGFSVGAKLAAQPGFRTSP